jgi:hypothetical protein
MFDMSIYLPPYNPMEFLQAESSFLIIADENHIPADINLIKQHIDVFGMIKHKNENISQNIYRGAHQFRRLLRLTLPEKIKHCKRNILIYANHAGDDIPTAIQDISDWEAEITRQRNEFGVGSLTAIIMKNLYDGCYEALEKNMQKLALLQHQISQYETKEIDTKIRQTMAYATNEQLAFIKNHYNPLLVLEMIDASGYQSMYETLKNVRCKNLNVKKIEQRVQLLHSQWLEFHNLVQMQQLKINKIDTNIHVSTKQTQKTEKQMAKTETAQKKSMATFWKTIIWVSAGLIIFSIGYFIYQRRN